MENICLLGAEDVRRGGNAMSSAADTMRQVVGNLDETLRRHEMVMQEMFDRFVHEMGVVMGAQ